MLKQQPQILSRKKGSQKINRRRHGNKKNGEEDGEEGLQMEGEQKVVLRKRGGEIRHEA